MVVISFEIMYLVVCEFFFTSFRCVPTWLVKYGGFGIIEILSMKIVYRILSVFHCIFIGEIHC